jgi:hypothetical protein
VDAICINQADVIEKNDQVLLMTQIYRRCAQVNIWLGKQESVGAVKGDPFRYLRHFENNRHFDELPGFHRDQINDTIAFEENEEMTSQLDDFLTMGRSPWWSRAWTVQESLLPENTKYMYAHWHSTWETFTAYNNLKNHTMLRAVAVMRMKNLTFKRRSGRLTLGLSTSNTDTAPASSWEFPTQSRRRTGFCELFIHFQVVKVRIRETRYILC